MFEQKHVMRVVLTPRATGLQTGPDEAGDVDVDEGGHEVLTVEAVHNSSVPRNGVGEVLQQSRAEFTQEAKPAFYSY